MEALKTFCAAAFATSAIYVICFIASLGWHQAEAIMDFLTNLGQYP